MAYWNVAEIEPLYSVKLLAGAQPTLSAGKNVLAVATASGISLLKTADGSLLASIPADMRSFFHHQIAFRDDGAQLALVQDSRRVRIWDLKKGELTRDFAIDAQAAFVSTLAWIGNDHLLVNSNRVVDIPHRVVAWIYPGRTTAAQVAGRRVWAVQPGIGRSSATLTSMIAPPQEAHDALAKLSEDEVLVIRPGLDVTVELPALAGAADPEASRLAVIEQLKERGMNVVPGATVKLVASLQNGATKTISYRPFGHARNAPAMTHQATEQVLTLSYQVKGETVWKFETRTSPPTVLHLQQGQSIDQSLQKSMQLDPKILERTWIPAYVARIPGGGEQKSPPRGT